MQTVSTNAGQEAKEKAAQLCREGLENYRHWNIERAIEALEAATTLDSTQADYFLYLAQAYMRLSDYEAMRRALGRFIHLESDQTLVDRFEAFFGSAMDRVETCLTHVMAGHDIPLAVIGAAIQMWLEFRLATGRAPIDLDGAQADVWAAALDYTVRKVNIHETGLVNIAAWYGVSADDVVKRYKLLIETLDIMPCDYRYFRGPQNPLDKLVEAANMLEELERRFYKT